MERIVSDVPCVPCRQTKPHRRERPRRARAAARENTQRREQHIDPSNLENTVKIDPKSTPGKSKIAPRRLQNRSPGPPRRQVVHRSPFGVLFYPSWSSLCALLGRSWGSPGDPGALRGASGGVPGGSKMGARRLPGKEPELGDLIFEKTSSRLDGSTIFEDPGVSKMAPKSTQNDSRIAPGRPPGPRPSREPNLETLFSLKSAPA